MPNELTKTELDFILTALEFTKSKFENYSYPTYQLKLERIAEVEKLMDKVREIKKAIHENC